MVFLVNLARVVFAPLLQPVAADFDVDTATLGVVTTAAWLGSAAPRLPTGILLTRFERHRVVAVTGALLVVTATFTAFSTSIPHLAVGAFAMGISSGMYFVAANPLVSELFPGNISRVVGVLGMWRQVAAVAAPLLVGAALLVADWRLTFLAVAVGAAVSTALLVYAARWTILPEAGSADRSLLGAVRAQWPLIVTGVALLGGVGFLWNGFFNLYGDYLTVAKGIDPGTGRLLLSLMFAAGIPAFLVSGRLGGLFPSIPMVTGFLGGFVASIVAITLVDGVVAVAVLSVLAAFSFYSISPAMDTYLLTGLPDEHRGSAYAAFSSIMMLVTALGSGTVGVAVAGGSTYSAVFQVLAVVVGLVGALMLLLYRLGRLPDAAEY